MSTRRILISCLVLSLFVTATSWAGSGIFATYVYINNKGGLAWYDLQEATALDDFNGYNFGSFTSADTFQIAGSEVNIWKNDHDEIYAATLYYRIYRQGSGEPAFTPDSIGWTASASYVDAAGITRSGSGDEKWAQLNSTQNILSGLGQSGTYVIEMYNTASGWLDNNHAVTWTLDANNGTANYKATFDYTADASSVPEPASMSIFVIGGGLALLARRRRQH